MVNVKEQKLGQNKRMSFSKARYNLELPNLVEVQTKSFKWFLEEGLGEVLRDVAVGQPVFLTKNGHGRYAVMDIEEYRQYELLLARKKLLTELEKGRRSGEEHGYSTLDDIEKELGIYE